ncbi:unnamed protein product [Calypogeia fissa]
MGRPFRSLEDEEKEQIELERVEKEKGRRSTLRGQPISAGTLRVRSMAATARRIAGGPAVDVSVDLEAEAISSRSEYY